MPLFPDTYGLSVGVAFGNTPYDTSPTYTEIGTYVAGPFTVQAGRSLVLTQPDPATVIVPLLNTDGRFDPDNGSGPYTGQLVPGKQIKIDVSASRRFTGFVESFAPSQTVDGLPMVNMTCTGVLGAGALFTIQDSGVRAMVLAMSPAPDWYWRLGNKDTDLVAFDETGNRRHGYYLGFVRAPAAGLAYDDNDMAASFGTEQGAVFGSLTGSGPTGTGAFCYIGIVQPSALPGSGVDTVWNSASQALQLRTDGKVQWVSPGLTTMVSGVVLATGQSYIVSVSRAADGVSFTLETQQVGTNGADFVTGTASGAYNAPGSQFELGYDGGTFDLAGVVDEWIGWRSSTPTDVNRLLLMQRMANGIAGGHLADLIAKTWGMAGLPASRLVTDVGDTFDTYVANHGPSIAGSAAVDVWKKAAATIGATLIERKDGVLEVRAYRLPAATFSVVVIADDFQPTPAGELPYDSLAVDRTFVDGTTLITSSDGLTTAYVTVGSGAVAQTQSIDIYATQVPEQPQDIAKRGGYLIAQGKSRVTVRIPMGSTSIDSGARAAALAVELEDLVEVVRRPSYGGLNVYQGRVIQRVETISPEAMTIEWAITPYPAIYPTYFKASRADAISVANDTDIRDDLSADRYDTDGAIGYPNLGALLHRPPRNATAGVASVYLLGGSVGWLPGGAGYKRHSIQANATEVAAVTDIASTTDPYAVHWATAVDEATMDSFITVTLHQNTGGTRSATSDAQSTPDAEFAGIWGVRMATDRHAARVYPASFQSIADNAETVVSPLANERYNYGAIHSAVTNNSRLTAKRAGIWIVGFNGGFAANGSNSRKEWALRKNGGNDRARQDSNAVTTGGIRTHGCVTSLEQVATNDYFEATVKQYSGSTVGLDVVGEGCPEFWAVELAGDTGGRVRRTSGLSTTTGVITKVTGYASPEFAIGNVTWDSTNSQWTLNETGVWVAWGCTEWASASNGQRAIFVYRNGLTIVGQNAHAAGGDPRAQCLLCIFEGVAGDTVDLRVAQTSGGTISTVATADYSSAFGIALATRGG